MYLRVAHHAFFAYQATFRLKLRFDQRDRRTTRYEPAVDAGQDQGE
jgi:hypothetical protein